MEPRYLSVEEAAERAGEEAFLRKVKAAVLPLLHRRGLVHGRVEEGRLLVADDDALARTLQLGIESFVFDQQGFSFMAVRAPIQEVAPRLKARAGVASYEEDVRPLDMQDGMGLQPEANLRHTFLVQMRSTPEWSVLLQTVHWFHSCDSVMATALACALSRELQSLAVAVWDDDFSGSSMVVCEHGERKEVVPDYEDAWEEFYAYFYEQGIYVPPAFIATEEGHASLHVAEPAHAARADHVVLRVPRLVESTGPHVFDKLRMMAEAMAEGLEDEEAFLSHMRRGVWQQAQALLATGEF